MLGGYFFLEGFVCEVDSFETFEELFGNLEQAFLGGVAGVEGC